MNWWIDEKLRVCYFESWWIDELMKKLDENSGCVILKVDELMNWWTCVILKLMNWWKFMKTWWIDEKEVWRKTTIFTIFAKNLKAITFDFPSIWTIFVKKSEAPVEKACTAHAFQLTRTLELAVRPAARVTRAVMVVWNLNAVPAMQFSYNTVISMDHSPAYTALHCIREGRMRECGYSEHFESNSKGYYL